MNQQLSSTLTLQQLKSLKGSLFTGRLILTGTASQRWDLYFYLGRILYATGGHHAMRRWLRYLSLHSFSDRVDPYQSANFQYFTDISGLRESEIFSCWEYFVLRDAIQNQNLSRERVTTIMQEIILEVLFDIQQANALIVETLSEEQLHPQLALFDVEPLWQKANQNWHHWKDNKLAKIFPDQSAVISRSARIRQEVSPAAYIALENLLDGKRSLREISALTGRNVREVVMSLLVYIEAGNITLVTVPDLIDPAERYFSSYTQSGSLLQMTSRDEIRNATSPQDLAQGARVAR